MKFKHLICTSSIVKFIPLLLLTFLASTLQAANLTSETETFSSDNVPGDRFGVAMAIASVEGNTMVIGAESADDIAESGVAYVFTRTGAGQPWTEAAKLVPSDGADNDFFGASVAISPDGGTIVIGAQGKLTYDDPLDVPDLGPAPTGIVYVYVKGAGAWANASETVQLHPSDPFDNDRFGKSVAIGSGTNGDEIIAVGAESVEIVDDNANGDGLIYVFDKPTTAGGWADWAAVATVPQVTPPTFTSAELARLRASDEGGFDHFHLGGSVAISEDGGVIVAGAYWWGETIGVDEDAGAAYVFVRPGAGTWVDAIETSFLQPSAPVLFEEMGRSIAIDKAGDTVVLGAPSPGGSTTGSAYVFTKPGAAWPDPGLVNETARLTASDGAVGDMFGNDVSISRGTAGDEKIVVGAPFTPYDNDAVPLPPAVEVGGAYVFNKPGGGAWVTTATETDRLSADGLLPDDRFGFSVAIASTDTGNDGLLIGAPERDTAPAPASPQDFQTGSFFRAFVADVDLSVAKTVQGGGTDFFINNTIIFDLLVTNTSSTTNATGVTLVDTLPAELTYVSDNSGGLCTPAGSVVTCNIGPLAFGLNTTISITTTANAAGTNLSNTGTVTGTEPDGNSANDSSSVTINIAANAPPTASAVTITDANGGTVIVGDTLNGTYTYADSDTPADAEGTSTFRWLRGATPVATTQNYTLVAADSGQDMTFEVTPVALTGTLTGTAVTSSAMTVVNSAPTATGVSITDVNGGTAVVGDVLNGIYTFADLDSDAEGTSTFRWLRGAVEVATTQNYTLVAADSGADMTFEVTPVAAAGAGPGVAVTSSAVTVVNGAPTATGVSITDANGGTVVVGDVLNGNYTYADPDNDAEGTSTFRWLRGATPVATTQNYTLVAADSGQNMTFEVTPVAAAGASPGTAVTSSAVTVTNSVPTVSGVSITDANGGSIVVGDVLNGNYTFADIDNDADASTFRWLRGAVEVATTQNYTLVAADSGQSMTFEVTPVATTGAGPGVAETSIAVVVVNSAPTASGVSITDANGGTAVVGDVLNGNYTFADPDNDADASTFRWLRGVTPVATTQNYTLVAADSGQNMTFEVTPIAAAGTGPGTVVTSSAVTIANSTPTATAVSITDANGGTAVVGDVLNGIYTFGDVDNDAEGTSTFRWLRGAVEVATTQNYTLVAADSGEDMTFEVTPVAATGAEPGSAVTSSAVTVANTAPTATAVSITDGNGGDAVVGDVLNGIYTFADVDNDAEGASTFRWLRGAVEVATTQNYTLVAADSGEDMTFEVTPVAAAGADPGAAVTSSVVTVVNSAPTATSVTITDDNGGVAVVGDLLTSSYNFVDLDNDAEGISTFRWLRGTTEVGTTPNYTLVAADSGQNITFEVTPVAATGTSPGVAATSNAIATDNSAPTATGVSITDVNGGDAIVGDVLNGNYTYADLDNDTEGTTTFRWLRGAVEVATTQNYTLVAADSLADMTFEVTPVATAGASPGVVVTSAAVTVVNSAPTATSVTITDDNDGIAVVGDTLSSSYTYADIDNDSEGTSTFRWLRGAVEVATTRNYTLVAADSGQNMSFEVTPVAVAGTSPGTPVGSNVIAANNSPPVATAVSITDVNAGDAVVGDQLNGEYTYGDVDNDAEGTSTFRWLRGGVEVATTQNYTLVAADSGTDITFGVTPVAADGTSPGTAVTSTAITVANTAPTASDGYEMVDEDASIAITLVASDADNDTLTYTITSQPANGTLSGTAPDLTYTHDGSETTTDSFTFTVNDGTDDSAAATVTITITLQPDAPVANGGSVAINEGDVAVIALDGSDADLDPIVFDVLDNPANGTADLTGFSEVTYTPNPGFTGTDSFAFSVTDGVFTSSATVLISVFPSGATLLPTATGNGWSFDITTDIATTLGLDASLVGEVVISSEAPLALVVNPVVNLAIFSGDDVSPADSGFIYPLGLFDFTVATTGTVEVMLQLPFGVDIPADAVIRKLDNTDTWVTLAAPTAVIDAPNGVITLILTDNDSNDRDPTVGIIRDPVGLAVAEVAPPGGGGSGGGSSGGGGSGGGSLGAILPLMFLLSMLQIIRQRRRYKV